VNTPWPWDAVERPFQFCIERFQSVRRLILQLSQIASLFYKLFEEVFRMFSFNFNMLQGFPKLESPFPDSRPPNRAKSPRPTTIGGALKNSKNTLAQVVFFGKKNRQSAIATLPHRPLREPGKAAHTTCNSIRGDGKVVSLL